MNAAFVGIPTLAPDIVIRHVVRADYDAIQPLHAAAFGPGRFARTAYRVRETTGGAISQHSQTAWRAGHLLGAVEMTAVAIVPDDGAPHGHGWLLGPLAVRPGDRDLGLGRHLVNSALESVARLEASDHVVMLVGDLSYYQKLGFERIDRQRIKLPGPVDPARWLIWRGPDGTRNVPAGLAVARPTH